MNIFVKKKMSAQEMGKVGKVSLLFKTLTNMRAIISIGFKPQFIML